MESLYVYASSIWVRWYCRKEQYAGWKDGTSAVLFCSTNLDGKLVHWFHGIVILICVTFKTSYRTGKLLTNGALENHFCGPMKPFGLKIEYHPKTAEDHARHHKFGNERPLSHFYGLRSTRGRDTGKETYSLQTLRHSQENEATKIHIAGKKYSHANPRIPTRIN